MFSQFFWIISSFELCISKPILLNIRRKLFYFLSTPSPNIFRIFSGKNRVIFRLCVCGMHASRMNDVLSNPGDTLVDVSQHICFSHPARSYQRICFISPTRQWYLCGLGPSLRAFAFSVPLGQCWAYSQCQNILDRWVCQVADLGKNLITHRWPHELRAWHSVKLAIDE